MPHDPPPILPWPVCARIIWWASCLAIFWCIGLGQVLRALIAGGLLR